jgi:hypothetical protein
LKNISARPRKPIVEPWIKRRSGTKQNRNPRRDNAGRECLEEEHREREAAESNVIAVLCLYEEPWALQRHAEKHPVCQRGEPYPSARIDMLRWYPDKFDVKVLGQVPEGDREAVREAAGGIACIRQENNTTTLPSRGWPSRT